MIPTQRDIEVQKAFERRERNFNAALAGLGILIVLGAATLALRAAAASDAYRQEQADCVVRTAAYYHYTGNPHSLEAWRLFIGECP